MEQANDKVVMEFPVLWEGWECDSKAWVMQREDGTRYLKMTSHGSAYEGKQEELHERISEYENVLKQTCGALALLTPNAAVKGCGDACNKYMRYLTYEEQGDALNLLALIHRDGGHHTMQVGVAQSLADAEQVLYKWRDAYDVLVPHNA